MAKRASTKTTGAKPAPVFDPHARFVADAVAHIRRDITRLTKALNATTEDYEYPVTDAVRRRGLAAVADADQCAVIAEAVSDPSMALVQLVTALRAIAVAWAVVNEWKRPRKRPVEWTPKRLSQLLVRRNQIATRKESQTEINAALAAEYRIHPEKISERIKQAEALYQPASNRKSRNLR